MEGQSSQEIIQYIREKAPNLKNESDEDVLAYAHSKGLGNATPPVSNSNPIIAQQADKFPTAAEQGNQPGALMPSLVQHMRSLQAGGSPTSGPSMLDKVKSYLPGWGTALQGSGGIIGGAVGGPAGVPLGIGAGEAIHQLGQHLFTPNEAPQSSMEAAHRIMEPAAVGAAAEGAMIGIPAIVNKVKGLRDPARGIIRDLDPRGTPAKGAAQAVAPDLIAAGETPHPFRTQQYTDQYYLSKFQRAKAGLQAASDSVPAGTTRLKAPIIEKIDAAIEELQIRATSDPNFAISGHEDALKVLAKERDKLASFPDESISFADLRKYRQQLDKAIEDSNGWSETAPAADKAAMQARKKVAGIIRDDLSQVSEELNIANREYSTYADPAWIIKARQTADVTKPALVKQLLKRYGPSAAIGGGVAGYEMWKSH